MFCKYCGNQLDENGKFCSNCGSPINDEQVNAKSEEDDAPQEQQEEIKINYAMPSEKNNENVQRKSKLAAGLFGIFLGVFGVHNFYLGFKGRAIAQLLLGIFGCCTGFTALVSGIWGIIEGIMILCGNISTDANGIELGE